MSQSETIIELLTRKIEDGESNWKLFQKRGREYEKIKEFDKSIRDYTMSLSLHEDPDTFFFRANLYRYKRDFRRAIFDYSKSYELEDENPSALYYRGRCYLEIKKYENALSDFTNAAENDGCLIPDSYYYRGRTYFKIKKFQKCIDDFTIAILIDKKKSSSLLFDRACVYFEMEQFSKAIEDLEKCISLDNENSSPAKALLGKCQEKLRRIERQAHESYSEESEEEEEEEEKTAPKMKRVVTVVPFRKAFSSQKGNIAEKRSLRMIPKIKAPIASSAERRQDFPHISEEDDDFRRSRASAPCVEKRVLSKSIIFDPFRSSDEYYVYEMVSRDGLHLKHAVFALRDKKRVVLRAVRSNGMALSDASDSLKNDKKVVVAAVLNNFFALPYASIQLRNDKKFILYLARKTTLPFHHIGEELKEDRDVVLEIVKKSGNALGHIYNDSSEGPNHPFLNDKKVVLSAVQENGISLQYASDVMKLDELIVFHAVRNDLEAFRYSMTWSKRIVEHFIFFRVGLVQSSLQRRNPNLSNNTTLQNKGDLLIEYSHPELIRKDKDFARCVLSIDGTLLRFFPSDSDDIMEGEEEEEEGEEEDITDFIPHRKDVELVKIATRNNPMSLKYCGMELKNNPELFISILKDWGVGHDEDVDNMKQEKKEKPFWIVEYASEELKTNRQFCLDMTSLNGRTLKFFYESMKEDLEITLNAVSNDGRAIQFVSSSLMRGKDSVKIKSVSGLEILNRMIEEDTKTYSEHIIGMKTLYLLSLGRFEESLIEIQKIMKENINNQNNMKSIQKIMELFLQKRKSGRYQKISIDDEVLMISFQNFFSSSLESIISTSTPMSCEDDQSIIEKYFEDLLKKSKLRFCIWLMKFILNNYPQSEISKKLSENEDSYLVNIYHLFHELVNDASSKEDLKPIVTPFLKKVSKKIGYWIEKRNQEIEKEESKNGFIYFQKDIKDSNHIFLDETYLHETFITMILESLGFEKDFKFFDRQNSLKKISESFPLQKSSFGLHFLDNTSKKQQKQQQEELKTFDECSDLYFGEFCSKTKKPNGIGIVLRKLQERKKRKRKRLFTWKSMKKSTVFYRFFEGWFVDGKREGFGKEFVDYSNRTDEDEDEMMSFEDENIELQEAGFCFPLHNKPVFEGNFEGNFRNGVGMEILWMLSYPAVAGEKKKNQRKKKKKKKRIIKKKDLKAVTMYEIPIYEGNYKSGKRNGIGVEYNLDKTKFIRGIWKNGKIIESESSFDCQMLNFEDIKVELTASNKLGGGAYGDVYRIEFDNFQNPRISLKKKKRKEMHSTDLEDESENSGEQEEEQEDDEEDEDHPKYVAVKIFSSLYSESGMPKTDFHQRKMIRMKVKTSLQIIGGLETVSNNIQHEENPEKQPQHSIISFFPKIYGIISGNSVFGYAMEYCKISIERLIRERQTQNRFSLPGRQKKEDSKTNGENVISYEEKERILNEVCLGVECLHSRGLIHRDLKWGNVLLDHNNTVKIIDFDTSLRQDTNQWKLEQEQYSLVFGTDGFQAPEVGKGHYDRKVDVFSFGLMIHSLLFDQVNPYISQYQCRKCGIKVADMSVGKMESGLSYHVRDCDFRPFVDPMSVEKIPLQQKYLIELMLLCWKGEPELRPSFEEIIRIMRMEKLKNRSYSILHVSAYIIADKKKKRKQQQHEKKKIRESSIVKNSNLLLMNTSLKDLEMRIKLIFSKEFESEEILGIWISGKKLETDRDLCEAVIEKKQNRVLVEFAKKTKRVTFKLPEKEEEEEDIGKKGEHVQTLRIRIKEKDMRIEKLVRSQTHLGEEFSKLRQKYRHLMKRTKNLELEKSNLLKRIDEMFQ